MGQDVRSYSLALLGPEKRLFAPLETAANGYCLFVLLVGDLFTWVEYLLLTPCIPGRKMDLCDAPVMLASLQRLDSMNSPAAEVNREVKAIFGAENVNTAAPAISRAIPQAIPKALNAIPSPRRTSFGSEASDGFSLEGFGGFPARGGSFGTHGGGCSFSRRMSMDQGPKSVMDTVSLGSEASDGFGYEGFCGSAGQGRSFPAHGGVSFFSLRQSMDVGPKSVRDNIYNGNRNGVLAALDRRFAIDQSSK
jgi:hypothetical protein